MRSDGQKLGNVLTDAVNWFKENNIALYSIQKDIGQEHWTSSNKCYAEMYIDDAALGIPLIHQKEGKPYVDWNLVESLLEKGGILQNA
jgi:hypothetical protein